MQRSHSRRAALLLVFVLLLTLLPGSLAAAQTEAPAVVSPEVIHTGTGPTGYEVTFRYYDPAATNVRIRGEWTFSDAAHTTLSVSAGRMPAQWQVGDFPMPASSGWPVTALTLDPATGVWSWTTPMPSGVYTYSFFRNCPNPMPSVSGCVAISDPGSPPWNTSGAIEPTTQVYVPSDPTFGTIDYSWQAANPVKGALVDVTYPSPQSTNPPGSHYLAIYTPPGYDPNRALPYPTLYLSHGAGGNEVDWSTQGVAGNIIDNLIAAGRVQPMVVVMTNFNGISGGNTGYATDVIQNVIPYVEANYRVSKLANDRAFAGLSAGGARANTLLFNYTTQFGAYSAMSNAGSVPSATSPLWQNPALRTRLGIQIGCGIHDGLVWNSTANEINLLTSNNIPFVSDLMNGGHEWHVWRILLRDFADTMAFKHTTTTVTREGTADRGLFDLTVTIQASTTEPAIPSGTVQFYVDGQLLETPKPVRDGVAKLLIARARLGAGDHTITAVYSGDNLYNTSAGQLTITR